MQPWCSSVSIVEMIVVSCPPCWVAVLVKTAAGFPMRLPFIQSPEVWSQKFLIWEHMLPKRVGVPIMSPSIPLRSASGSATGMSFIDFFAFLMFSFQRSSGTSSATCFRIVSPPASRTPSATAFAILNVWPYIE